MNWGKYFVGFARHAALKSKDSTKVGAVLIGPDREIRLTSFNGPPRGVFDLPIRRERPQKLLYSSHAEANLIAFAAREGIHTKGCSVYVTHHPCAACARTLIQAGITAIIHSGGAFSPNADWDADFEAARQMCLEAKVTLVRLNESDLD